MLNIFKVCIGNGLTMKHLRAICRIVIFVLITTSLSSQSVDYKIFPKLDNGDILLEDFENEKVGDLPEFWRNRDGSGKPKYYDANGKKRYKYQIATEDSNIFLRYDGLEAKHLSLPLKKSKVINIYENPTLSWRWRAWHLPEGASEMKKKTNDVALSVYVVFKTVGVFRKPQSIRYTWSSTLPADKVLTKFGGKQKIVVLRSGSQENGRWLIEKRNLVEDYKLFFGAKPPACPLSILILSDANNTKDHAKGDYDDFVLEKLKTE